MVDIFILIIAFWAIFTGWRDGLLRQLASLVGIFVGLFVAAICYSQLGEFLSITGSISREVTNIIAFFLLWIIIPIMLGMFAKMTTSIINAIHLGWLNRLLGTIISVLKYGILMSCIFNAMLYLRIIDTHLTSQSKLFQPTCDLISFVWTNVNDHVDINKLKASADTLWVDIQKK